MFQVEHHSPLIFEKVLTSIEDLIKDANFECKDEGIEVSDHKELLNVTPKV